MYNQTVIFDSDFNGANPSLVKFKGTVFLLYELNDESALSLILAFKSRFFLSVTSRFCMSRYRSSNGSIKNQNILIYHVE